MHRRMSPLGLSTITGLDTQSVGSVMCEIREVTGRREVPQSRQILAHRFIVLLHTCVEIEPLSI